MVAGIEQEVRVLALLVAGSYVELHNQLQSLNMLTTFVDHADDLRRVVRNGEVYEVALVPASLPAMEWWTIWGELALLDRRPAILVYTQTSSFQLWSGVLEAGGYDLLTAPFTHQRVKESVLRAAGSFERQSLPDGKE